MKRHTKYRILGALMGVNLFVQGSLSAFAAEIEENIVNDTNVVYENAEADNEIMPATEYIGDMDTARETLSAIIEEQSVTALVYLCDIYEMKAEADPESATVYEVTSGQSVQLLDVGEDSGQNIWFRVLYESDNDQVQGYIRRDYLAYSDERVIDWESQNISSRARRRARAFGARASYPDVASFPESYQEGLMALKSQHPNWIFVRMDTGLDWNTVIANESEFGRNLIRASTAIDAWKNGMYSTTWANASPGIIKYYMDPRNFLTESGIFQFEQLTYNESYHTLAAIQAILDGTFMSGLIEGTNVTYAGTFLSIGQTNKVSPFLLASRVRQEQGTLGTSPLISGTYPGYEGLYNYYNIGASGTSDIQVIQTGLDKARKEGWTSRTNSLVGGSRFLVSSYVFQGQDTLYLQKFDVDNKFNGLYWHQYMQNVQAPASEAQSTYRAYQNCGVINHAFVFKIPVYNNMPSAACVKPSLTDSVTLNTSAVSNLPVGATAVLTAYINGNPAAGAELTFTSSNEAVATVDGNGVITGILPGTATISCTKENATTAVCTVTVIKADTISYTIPTLAEITYDPLVTLESIALPEGFSWENKDIVPTVDNNGYTALYTPDSTRYNAVTLTIPLKVNKAVPSYSVPLGFQGEYGTELSSVGLPAGFAWETPETVLNTLGTVTYMASYNPDVFNYNSVTGIGITVGIICSHHHYGDWNIIKEASCTETGTKERVCTVCGSKESGEVPALGHNMEDGICDRCGISETESGNGDSAGNSGDAGNAGSTGNSGDTGNTGNTGNSGDAGNTGNVGNNGDAGNTGNAGNSGDAGNTGNAGNSGDAGNAGNTGNSGDTGNAGNAGNSGDTGNTGNTGNSGDTGNTGNAGNSGDTGNTGNAGNSGDTGNTGNTGNSGDTGNTGNGGNIVNAGNIANIGNVGNTSNAGGTENTGNTGSAGDNGNTGGTGNAENNGANGPAANAPVTDNNNTNNTNAGNIADNTTNNAVANNSTANNNTANTGSTAANNSTANTVNNNTGNSSTTGNTANNNNNIVNNNNTSPDNAANNGSGSAASDNSTSKDNTTVPDNNAAADSSQAQRTTAGNTAARQPITEQTERETAQEQRQEEKVRKVDMTVTSVVPTNLLGIMQEKAVDLELEMGNGITWLLHGNTMSRMPESEIDMGVEMGASMIPEEILQKTAAGEDTVGLVLKHEGEFGFEADLILSLDKKYSGMIANLFYYDPVLEQLEFIADAGINEEGTVTFTFTHASEYVIVISEMSMKDGRPEQSAVEVPTNHANAKTDEAAIKNLNANASFPALAWQKLLIFGMIFVTAMIGAIAILYAYRRGMLSAKTADETGEDITNPDDYEFPDIEEMSDEDFVEWFDEESADDYRDPAETE